MDNNKTNQYIASIAIPPGETLLEVIESMGMTQKELATRMGRPIKTINEIIKGKAAITPETASQLERVLGVKASFWSNLETNYRATLYRLEEADKLAKEEAWAKKFPLKKMKEYGWIPNDYKNNVKNILSFFGVASPEAWNNVWHDVQCGYPFRKSVKLNVDIYALSSWIRQGELAARKKTVEIDNQNNLTEMLAELKKISCGPSSALQTKGVDILAKSGIKLLFVRELPNMPVNGVTRKLNDGSILIQLSLRYKTNDQVWFSLFHEIGHILLHKKYDFTFTNKSSTEIKRMEEEADVFASNTLISLDEYRKFMQGNVNENTIREFAKEQKIAPGIVVGRWQHDTKKFNMYNKLKERLTWA